ncbi:ammonium transporter [Kiritimatiellota bacterium B12222]|nr:ammonium transporter [Kiritimatiellota bacterium B12222]
MEVMDEVVEVVEVTDADVLGFAIDNMFLLLASILVIFMQAGFAILESGLNHSKNTVNILMKNVMDFAVGVLLYFLIGYGIMYTDVGSEFMGKAAPVSFDAADQTIAAGELTTMVDFLFQAAFAATAATIVSGAVAGRLKFAAYIIYTVILTGVIYPISGYWKWGGGWLDDMGFYDFAGSIVVHAVGGFAGLAAAIVLGPRIGRFGKDKTAMPGHNLTFAALGVFILLVGWFGFNPGSQLAIVGADNTMAVMLIAVNTTLAAAAGAVFALILSWILDKKPDLTMALNGILAGLVGITANCDGVTNWGAIAIGAIAGLLVVAGIKLLEAVKIDDPVGAWPVHGLCGLWGGIATGIFGDSEYWGEAANGSMYGNMTAQITGSLVIAAYAFVTMFILFTILKAIGILRVSEEDEMVGLDLSEHGHSAYGE